MAIFRAMGARPRVIVGLLVLEASLMSAVGAALGVVMLYGGLVVAQPMIDAAFGLWLAIEPATFREGIVVLCVVIAGAIVSAVPAIRAYRASVADGMMVKI